MKGTTLQDSPQSETLLNPVNARRVPSELLYYFILELENAASSAEFSYKRDPEFATALVSFALVNHLCHKWARKALYRRVYLSGAGQISRFAQTHNKADESHPIKTCVRELCIVAPDGTSVRALRYVCKIVDALSPILYRLSIHVPSWNKFGDRTRVVYQKTFSSLQTNNLEEFSWIDRYHPGNSALTPSATLTATGWSSWKKVQRLAFFSPSVTEHFMSGISAMISIHTIILANPTFAHSIQNPPPVFPPTLQRVIVVFDATPPNQHARSDIASVASLFLRTGEDAPKIRVTVAAVSVPPESFKSWLDVKLVTGDIWGIKGNSSTPPTLESAQAQIAVGLLPIPQSISEYPFFAFDMESGGASDGDQAVPAPATGEGEGAEVATEELPSSQIQPPADPDAIAAAAGPMDVGQLDAQIEN